MGSDPFSTLDPFGRTRSPFDPPQDPQDDEDVAAASAPSVSFPTLHPSYAPQPQHNERGLLRSSWDVLTSPFRALFGVTNTSLVHLLGIKAMFPEAYEKAHEEMLRGEAERAGPDILNEAAALPGAGDVAAAALPDSVKESLPGKILTPVGKLALNILGDPITYAPLAGEASAVAKAVSKAGEAEKILTEAQAGIQAMRAAGKVDDAANAVRALPALAGNLADAVGKLAKARTEETALGRGARAVAEATKPGVTGEALAGLRVNPSFARAVATAGKVGAALPFSPAAGLIYAPEIVEGVGEGVSKTIDEVKAGRYAEAAATGAGALLTAGLGAMVAHGVMTEREAAVRLERAMAEQLGEPAPVEQPTQPPPPVPPPPQPQPTAVEVPPTPTPAGVAPVPTPEVSPTTVAAPAPPVAAEPTPTPVTEPESPPLTPGSERIRVERSPATLQTLSAIVAGKVTDGTPLTKRDLIEAGLITPKQAKSYSMPALLDALGGTHLRPQLESTPGGGFRVKAPAEVSAPTEPAPAGGTVAEGTPPPPTTVPGVSAEPAAQPVGSGVDRRVDLGRRKAVNEMTLEEAKHAVLHDELTGLGSRRAFDEDASHPDLGGGVASMDMSGLKWFNDTHGHAAGDVLIKTVAGVIAEEQEARGYRGGTASDEFLLRSKDPVAVEAAAKRVQDRLANTVIEYTAPDGTVHRWKGVRLDYGIGAKMEEADAALKQNRAGAVARGERLDTGPAHPENRGQRPLGLVDVAPEGGNVQVPRPAEERPAPAAPAAEGVGQAEGVVAPPAPNLPPKITRAQIDEVMKDQSMRDVVDKTLSEIAADAGKKPLDLNRTDIAASFPGDENKSTRALLYRVLEARKKLSTVQGPILPAATPQAALIRGEAFPGEGRQHFRTPRELVPEEESPPGGFEPPPQRPTGIGELPVPEPPPVHAINTIDQLNAAREELDQIRNVSASHPHLADEFADRDIELQDAIESAYSRNVGALPMPRRIPPPKPTPPPARPMLHQEMLKGRPLVPAPEGPTVASQITAEAMADRIIAARGANAGDEAADFVRKAMGAREAPPQFEPGAPRPPEYEQQMKAVIGRRLASSGITLETFERRSRQFLGHGTAEATPDQLSLLFTLAEKNPGAFGARIPELDPALAAHAAERLAGGTAHLETQAERGFVYDPASPAGKAHRLAASLEQYGVPAEQNLQDTMLKWIGQLSLDDERFVHEGAARVQSLVNEKSLAADALEKAGKADEAALLRDQTIVDARGIMERAQKRTEAAQNRRRLLLADPADEAAQGELTGLLNRAVRHGSIDYRKSPTNRAAPIESVIDTAIDEMPSEDAARSALTAAPAAVASGPVKIPARPPGVSADAWLKKVRADPELYRQHLESLAAIATTNRESQAGKGTNVPTEHITALREMANNFGLSVDKKRGADRTIKRLATLLRTDVDQAKAKPQAASVSQLLSEARVGERGPAWNAAVRRGAKIGDTDARVVDFEDDAPGLSSAFAPLAHPLVDPLARTVAEISTITDMPARFGGFAVSPQLAGLRLTDDSVFLNALHARHQAEAELVGSKLVGDARQSALDYNTARNLVDISIHEIAHAKATHDARTGDRKFIAAYTGAIRDLGARYVEFVRQVRDEAGPVYRQIDPLMPDYARAVDNLQGVMGVESSLAGNDVGAGQGGAAAVETGPGGAAGSPAVGAEPGLRPIRPVPPGGVGAAEGLRAGAAADEGARPLAGEEAGAEGGGIGSGAGASEAAAVGGGIGAGQPHASLTTPLTSYLANKRRDAVFARVQRGFARTYASITGNPDDADRLLTTIEALKTASPEVREKLRNAKPQGEIDVGLNARKYLPDSMSDEQKEATSLLLMMRNSEMSRATPLTHEQIREQVRQLAESNVPEEWISQIEKKGLRDPADFAFTRSVVGLFGHDVDTGGANLRAAQIEADAARLSGNSPLLLEAERRVAGAKDFIAHAETAKLNAIFSLIPETTRVARVLASLRSIVRPLTPEETFKARFLGAMQAAGLKKDVRENFWTMLQDTISQPVPDWTAFVTAFRRATEPKWFDKFLEFWKAGLLGIPTQMVNIGGNAMWFGLRNAENVVTNLTSRFFSGLTGAPQTRFVGETSARMLGGSHGFREAWDALKYDLGEMARLRPPDPANRLQMGTFYDDPGFRQLFGAIGGKTGEYVRIPFKLLDSFDNFFKHMIRNQEWAAQANRLAQRVELRSPGEAINHATSRIFQELREIARDPITNQGLLKKTGYKQALEAGRNMATVDTFQEALVGSPVREAARAYQQATNRLPALQLITPFFKTPYNIIAEGMKRTPMAGAWAIKKYMRGEITDHAFVEDMVKSAFGTAGMMVMFQAALNDQVTGSGPVDPKEVEILKRTGWQPRSIKIGNQYFQYQRLAPFSIVLGAAADLAEAYKRKDTATTPELISKGVQSINNNILDQSFIAGLSSLIDILSDPEKKGAAAFRQLEASLVPNVIGVVPFAHAARGIDPYYRETQAFTTSPIQAQIPFASKLLPPQYTPTGEIRERKGNPLERVFSPILRSEEESGPIADAAGEIARLGGPLVSAPQPFFRVGDDKIYYTEDERQEIARAQEKGFEKVGSLIRRGDYQRMPDGRTITNARPDLMTKQRMIEREIDRYRGPVVDRINRQALRRAKLEQ